MMPEDKDKQDQGSWKREELTGLRHCSSPSGKDWFWTGEKLSIK